MSDGAKKPRLSENQGRVAFTSRERERKADTRTRRKEGKEEAEHHFNLSKQAVKEEEGKMAATRASRANYSLSFTVSSQIDVDYKRHQSTQIARNIFIFQTLITVVVNPFPS